MRSTLGGPARHGGAVETGQALEELAQRVSELEALVRQLAGERGEVPRHASP